jgi:hypothetical protein
MAIKMLPRRRKEKGETSRQSSRHLSCTYTYTTGGFDGWLSCTDPARLVFIHNQRIASKGMVGERGSRPQTIQLLLNASAWPSRRAAGLPVDYISIHLFFFFVFRSVFYIFYSRAAACLPILFIFMPIAFPKQKMNVVFFFLVFFSVIYLSIHFRLVEGGGGQTQILKRRGDR